jgi:hypothetical protein
MPCALGVGHSPREEELEFLLALAEVTGNRETL